MDKLGPVAKSLGLRVPPAAPQGLIGTPLTPLRCFLLLTQSKYNKYLYQGGPRAQRQAQQEWKLNEFHDAQVLLIWPFRSLFWNAYGLSPFSNCVQFCNNLEKGLSFLSVKCSWCFPFCWVSSKKTTVCTFVQTSKNDICVCLVIQKFTKVLCTKWWNLMALKPWKLSLLCWMSAHLLFNSLVQRDA